jgi:hypothetical protein
LSRLHEWKHFTGMTSTQAGITTDISEEQAEKAQTPIRRISRFGSNVTPESLEHFMNIAPKLSPGVA